MKSAAIFDMDGLMFDTERIYRDNWMLYAPRFGYKADPEFPKAVCGTSGQHMLDVIESYYPGIDAMGFKLAVRSVVEAAIEKSVPLMPGIRGILQMFSERGVPCAVSSKKRPRGVLCGIDIGGGGRTRETGPGYFSLRSRKAWISA